MKSIAAPATAFLHYVPTMPAKDFEVSNGQTLQELLTERVSIFAQGERPAAIIDEHVEKMFRSVIDDAFRSYGDLGKAVSAAVKNALPGNIENCFELTRYNDLVANALRQKWASSGVTGDMLRRAEESIADVMKDIVIPETVSLRALLDQFVEDHKQDAVDGQWEAPRIEFEDKSDRFIYIYFDPEPESDFRARTTSSYSRNSEDRSLYKLKHCLGVSIKGTTDKGAKFGDVFTAKVDELPLGRKFNLHSNWERLIGALYFGGANLVIDCDADEFSYGIYD